MRQQEKEKITILKTNLHKDSSVGSFTRISVTIPNWKLH